MVPEAADGNTFWEHLERYRFASAHLCGVRILDVACGEGYGTAALATSGTHKVVGVDVSPESCSHARLKYGVDARVGSAESIPLADASIDSAVSFETIEHLDHPERFLDECHRVLAPGGLLIISTPNRPVYHLHTPNNPYHHHEMSLAEFRTALNRKFEIISMFGQCAPLPSLLRLRGVRRLPAAFYRVVAPHVGREPSADERSRVIQYIQCPGSWRDRFNPFAVRLMSGPKLQTACYLIAVARRKEA